MQNSDVGQRDSCAGEDFLSYLCAVCGCEFQPRRKDQVTCGNKRCRHGRPRLAIRAQEHEAYVERQLARRCNRVLSEYRLLERGTQARDNYKENKPNLNKIKDRFQRHSLCVQCGTVFVDDNGKTTPSPFAFCGETALTTGDCKRAWLDALHKPSAPVVKFQCMTLDDTKQGKRFNAPKHQNMPKSRTYFCPLCVEVVMKKGKEVRRTTGMYRQKDHECGEVIHHG
jgi:hypothetical protein